MAIIYKRHVQKNSKNWSHVSRHLVSVSCSLSEFFVAAGLETAAALRLLAEIEHVTYFFNNRTTLLISYFPISMNIICTQIISYD